MIFPELLSALLLLELCSRYRTPFSCSNPSILDILLCASPPTSCGRKISTGLATPFSWIGVLGSNVTADLANSYVSFSHRIPPKPAACISLAAMITLKPTAVYSQRTSEPASPQNTVPVAMPIAGGHLSLRSLCEMSSAHLTHLTASSGCTKEGMPKAILKRVPLSSAISLATVPSNLPTLSCTASTHAPSSSSTSASCAL
mmetsp:Transcript_10680/g.20257  ORF Transcript_10680/g.20257 Transcript_10680/m.20257 type:complete len:201 (-) Transcript_10680:2399-3001(-)